jgi:putative ABC transport system permease protein
MALTGAGNAETVRASAVTASFFGLFGVRVVTGRVFDDGQKAVVISRSLWKRQWQMAADVVGRAIALDGETYTIAGVAEMPADLIPGTEILVPLAPRATESRSAHDLEVVGRLAPGAEARQAAAELSAIATSIARDNPRSNAGWSMRPIALSEYVIGPRTSGMVWMIFAAVALLWLLACANVAGLQMARSLGRRHEMNTRLALGASRGRLFAQNLTESLVLAGMGGFFGLDAAQLALQAIRSSAAASFPRLAQVQMTYPTIGMAVGFMLASTLLFTIFTGRTPGSHGCREISRRDRGRDVLIVVQVALASVLLLAAGLLFHSFLRLEAVDPGFDPERILTVHVSLPSRTYETPRKVAFFREATSRVKRLPEVESAGATNVAPFSGEGTANRFGREEEDVTSGEFRAAAWRAVTADFFATLGIPLKRGRLFTEADVHGSREVVILSESMARKFWPDQNPIGKRLLWGRSGSPKTIVGIVGDLRDLAVDAPPVPTMFRPFAQLADAPMTLVIRTRADPSAAIADVRREIWAIDRDAALDFQPLRSAMSRSILQPRASLVSVAGFALVAMITAAFGLYGLIGYRVNQRQQEIGMRLALGAPAGSVRWSVQKRCLGLVCSGLAIGLPVAYGVSTLMRSLLYETQPAQGSAYGMVVLVFGAVASMASCGPARRASRMDPAVAIRHE